MSIWKLVPLILLALAALTILPSGTASAADEPTALKSLKLWVNPEYDDPRVLTMIEGHVDIQGRVATVNAPALVRFMVPANAEFYSAGFRDEQGIYQRAPDWDGVTNIKPSGIDGWNIVSFTIHAADVRVEWYDDAIQGLPDKKISFDFKTLYPVTDLSVFIQKPTKAANFQVNPKEHSTVTDSEGFQVFRYSLSNIARDATVHYDISYTKSDSEPSIAASQQGTGGSGNGSRAMLLAVAIGGVLAIALIVIFRQGGSRRRTVPARARRRGQATPTRGTGGGARRFCTECGAGLPGSAKFCPECGEKSR